jgi:two-component system, cell cycle sensor histidine kinase and response regulator CckA
MENLAKGAARSTGRETIMLVEDEGFVRGVTRAVLESAGYSVIAAKDGAEAGHMYEEHFGLVDLLLTDIVLPGEDGRRLAKRLSKLNAALQVLFVTGYFGEMEVWTLPEDGETLLRKPFAATTLLRKVRQLLDRRRGSALAKADDQARLR